MAPTWCRTSGQLRRGPRRRARGRRRGCRSPAGELGQPLSHRGPEDGRLRDLRHARPPRPTYHCIPVGNAGNITSYWKGYREYPARPAVTDQSARHAAAFRRPAPRRLVLGHRVDAPRDDRHRHPHRQSRAPATKRLAAARDSGGFIDLVTDDEFVAGLSARGATEGGVLRAGRARRRSPGLRKARDRRPASRRGALVACVLTGHGLKDPDTAVRTAAAARVSRRTPLAEIERALAAPAVPAGVAAPVRPRGRARPPPPPPGRDLRPCAGIPEGSSMQGRGLGSGPPARPSGPSASLSTPV